jgi:hypothetical protein
VWYEDHGPAAFRHALPSPGLEPTSLQVLELRSYKYRLPNGTI